MGKKRLTLSKRKSELKELLEQSYIGHVIMIDDPEYIGRCKIRVYGIYGSENTNLGMIPDEDLPWAYPYYDMCFGSENGSGRFSTPKMNSKVRIILDGDQYHPRYFSMETLDTEMQEAIAADYINFHSLLWDSDEQLKMYYAVNTGFILDLKESLFNILPDNSILIKHKDGTAVIEMKGNDIDILSDNAVTISSNNQVTINSNYVHANGVNTDLGANPIFSNMNGEPTMELLKIMATAIDNKYPVTPGILITAVNSMEALILSATVKTTP